MDKGCGSCEVSEQLDQKLDEIMTTLNEILSSQAELDECMKNGFIMISKARYSIGLNRISSLQYSEDGLEDANTKVLVTEGDNDSQLSFSLYQDTAEQDSIQLSTMRHRKEDKLASSCKILADGVQNLNISDTLEEDKLYNGNQKQGTESTKSKRDPLTWFGVLVPQPLRQSQTHFKRATDHCCHLATLKIHLLKLLKHYDALILKKELILSGRNSTENDNELSDDV